jgi:hypothetical protein
LSKHKGRTQGCQLFKGKQLILIHTGSEDGWVEGAEEIWVPTGKKTDNYHNNINHKLFIHWFKNKLCKNLSCGSLKGAKWAMLHWERGKMGCVATAPGGGT